MRNKVATIMNYYLHKVKTYKQMCYVHHVYFNAYARINCKNRMLNLDFSNASVRIS